MDDAEDLAVDIDEPRGDEEGAGSGQFLPLLLLQHLDLFLRRNLLLELLAVLFDLFGHLIAHLLHADRDLSPFLLDQLFKFLVVVGLLPEPDGLAGVSLDLVELEPERDMHADGPKVIDDDLLHIDVLECVWIVYQLRLVVDPFLVALEGAGSSAVGPRTDIVDALGGHSAGDQAADEGNGVGGTAVDSDILWLLDSPQ